MKLFIPTIGTKLQLEKDWWFKLFDEPRNYGVIIGIGAEDVFRLQREKFENMSHTERLILKGIIPYKNEDGEQVYNDYVPFNIEVILPKFTLLKVNRIYIRSGAKEYDSVTFTILDCPDKRLVSEKRGGLYKMQNAPLLRFWAKLKDVNTMEAAVV